MSDELRHKVVHSASGDARVAVREVMAALGEAPSSIIFFCSHRYDLSVLAEELRQLRCQVVGCTSAGQIAAEGFIEGGLTVLALFGERVSMTPYVIDPLTQQAAVDVAQQVNARRAANAGRRAFGLLLFDGLSMAEELVTAALYQSLVDVPLVGGSAGDGLEFKHTYVYVDGTFREKAACLCLVETDVAFTTFKMQHFEPHDEVMVVTRADPARRRVYEINGESAIGAYARALGVRDDQVNPAIYSQHPFVMRLRGRDFIRSIGHIDADRTLNLFCAVEEGLVLRLGHEVPVLPSIATAFADVDATLGGAPSLVIGCDCILRRLEFGQRKNDRDVAAMYAGHNVFGFSTYGEQFNSSHVNQTFTGVAFGR